MSENTSFVHDCGQEIIVVGWTHGYWRRPTTDENICGLLPLKNDVCTCGEVIRRDKDADEEFTGTLFGALFGEVSS